VYSIMKRTAVILILILAFCGLADAAYLAQHVASGAPVICNVHGLSGCNTVLQSQYSHPLGIPLASAGVFFYGLLFVLAALELFIVDRFLRRLLQWISIIGIIASAYFVFLEAFIIHAFCEYCLTSALITLLIFLCAGFIEPRQKQTDLEPQPTPPTDSSPSRLTMPPAP
jgi:uncharacterized membrane protein